MTDSQRITYLAILMLLFIIFVYWIYLGFNKRIGALECLAVSIHNSLKEPVTPTQI